MRLLRADEYPPDGTMVPVEYYVEENADPTLSLAPVTTNYVDESSNTGIPEGQFQMDRNTLWFIANGGARQGGPGQPPRPYRPAQQAGPPGPCYHCGEDHWIRDCPYLKDKKASGPALPHLIRHCAECGIKHLVSDCPAKPGAKPPVTLNLVEVIPSESSSASEAEKIIPLKVITRAQAKAKKPEQEKDGEDEKQPQSESSKSSRNSWKARRQRREASKKRKAEQGEKENTKRDKTHNNASPAKQTENQMKGEAGSVLADKLFEPLDAMLKAYEARLKPLETMEERWKNYPDAAQESRQLEIYKKLVEAVQAIEEQQKLNQPLKTEPQKTNGIKEDDKLSVILEEDNETGSVEGKTKDNEPIMIPNTSVPEVDEEWANQLWKAVKHAHLEIHASEKPPLEEIDFDQKTLELELRSEYGDAGSEKSEESKADTFKTLPSYQGSYEAKSDVRKLPSVQGKPPIVQDFVNLAALMSAPIKVTLPLTDVLRVKPELWKDVGKMLRKLGIEIPISETISTWNAEKRDQERCIILYH